MDIFGSITSWLVGIATFVLAPFIAPQMPPVVDQPVIEENQPEMVPIEEESLIENLDSIESNQNDQPVITDTQIVKTIDPYCAQYAFRYSDEKYKSESNRPKEEKSECKKGQKKEVNSITDLEKSTDAYCETVEKKAKKEFLSWEKKYNEYKTKCPNGVETYNEISVVTPSKESNTQREDDDNNDEDLKPCFVIEKLTKYAEDIYYKGSFTLNGSCSGSATSFGWYIDGVRIGMGEVLAVPWNARYKGFKGLKVGVPVHIKLITTFRNGISKSEERTITFRQMPGVEPCITPNSGQIKELELNKEIKFDASCTKYTDENPIVKYSWIFRDGEDGEKKSGIEVSHTFTKGSTKIVSYSCGGQSQALGVELILETKSGNTNNVHYYYCIKK